MSTEVPRTSRLETRIAPEVLAVVRRAAEMQGRSVSDFVVSAAQEAAYRAISDAQLIRLSLADQERFAAALLDPPALPAGLVRAALAHARLVSKES
jgi:uncharacterized protein (DUF1778 family)